MSLDGSMPSYETIFGDLAFRSGDESRTVYSPAAYQPRWTTAGSLLEQLDDGSVRGTTQPGARTVHPAAPPRGSDRDERDRLQAELVQVGVSDRASRPTAG